MHRREKQLEISGSRSCVNTHSLELRLPAPTAIQHLLHPLGLHQRHGWAHPSVPSVPGKLGLASVHGWSQEVTRGGKEEEE